jgi:hypothetical protein
VAPSQSTASHALVFFNRSVLESLAMLHEVALIPELQLRERVARYAFHNTVLLVPPWAAIDRNGAERGHTLLHAQRVHSQLVTWYRRCGFALNSVALLGMAQRADHVLQTLATAETRVQQNLPMQRPPGGTVRAALACPAGLEPATPSLEGWCSIQLSYGQ